MGKSIPQKCPKCCGAFRATEMKTTCPHCGTLTELGIQGEALYAYVRPVPVNGLCFTATDLIREFEAPHVTGSVVPSFTGVNLILKSVGIDDICGETGLTPLLWTIANKQQLIFAA
ncbi:MAG: hypothetical protein AAF483_14230, partial [Planctomycetota bacterium]